MIKKKHSTILTGLLVAIALIVCAVPFAACENTLTPTEREHEEIRGAPGAATRILVYADDSGLVLADRYPIVALENLGYTGLYTATDDPTTFYDELTTNGPWDLIIVDHCNIFALGNYWPDIEAYILAGGKAIVTTFDIDGSNSVPTTLWATMGASWVSDFSSPQNVYWWDPGHKVLNGVPEFTTWTEMYADDGDKVEPTGDGVAIAGFTGSPTTGEAAIIIGKTRDTILQTFLECENREDLDTDGVLDAVEIYMNKIQFLMEPEVVGGNYISINALTLLAPYILVGITVVALGAALLKKKRMY